MVGTARFELATSRTPSVRATRLRHVPFEGKFTIVTKSNCQTKEVNCQLLVVRGQELRPGRSAILSTDHGQLTTDLTLLRVVLIFFLEQAE